MKKLSVFLIMGLIMCFMLSVYPLSAAGKKEEAEEITIRVWMWGEVVAPGMNDWYKESAEMYQEMHPNVIVEPTEIPMDDLQQSWMAAVAAGDPPDIILMGRQEGINAAAADEILPIDEFWTKEEIDTILPAAQRELGWEGHVWMVPEYMEAWGMVYNKEIFAEVGIKEPPATWADLIGMAGKIKRAGYTPLAIGWQDGYMSPWLFDTIAIQCLDDASDLHAAVLGEQHFTDPKHADWWKIIVEMRDKGYFNEDAASIGLGEGLDLFYTGKVAFGFVVQPVAAAYVAELGDDVVGAMKTPLPPLTGKAAGSIPITPMPLALANGKHPDVAADFLRYLHTEERVKALYDASGAIQASKLFDPDSAKSEVDRQFAEWFLESTTFTYNWHYTPQIDADSYGIGQLLIAGEIDAAEAAQMMEDAAAKWRKENPDDAELFRKTAEDWMKHSK
jgi:ABC-type glycerol-3-phosphate transport system substrate-binding protein